MIELNINIKGNDSGAKLTTEQATVSELGLLFIQLERIKRDLHPMLDSLEDLVIYQDE